MIPRDIAPVLKDLFQRYPFVTVTGPRQSGKTTLCRETFPHLAYINLEAPDEREFAERDPRGLLNRIGSGAILDEIQRVPDFLSYLQVWADERRENSLCILTGSEQFRLSDAINQSLAGRTALLGLLPFSLAERRRATSPETVDELLHRGFYPRILDQGLEPREGYAAYFETYVERDLRQLAEIRNLSGFRRFVRLCAGRVGQMANLSSLGADAGVSHTTAREWLTLLEASYIAFLLPPYFANIRKRLVKSPKIYFYDVGLASYLLGIEHPSQVANHPLRGALFENMVIVEALKFGFNRGRSPSLSFFRDSRGLECDLLMEAGHGTAAIEIKSGETVTSDSFGALGQVGELIPNVSMKAVVYAGAERQSRSAGEAVPFSEFEGLLDRFEVERRVATLVRKRTSPAPVASTESVLDNVFRMEVRPILDGLERSSKVVAPLFHRTWTTAGVTVEGRGEVDRSNLLEARHWKRTKDKWIVGPGFALDDAKPIELKQDFSFQEYTGKGKRPFNLTLSIVWRLGGDGFRREIAVGDGEEREPDFLVMRRYADLDRHTASVDQVCADVLRAAFAEIERRSGG